MNTSTKTPASDLYGRLRHIRFCRRCGVVMMEGAPGTIHGCPDLLFGPGPGHRPHDLAPLSEVFENPPEWGRKE